MFNQGELETLVKEQLSHVRDWVSMPAARERSKNRLQRNSVRQENRMNLEFLSHQAIFDQAVQHLFHQRQAALLPRGGGAYRGYCGGCPVGNFIKPRDYVTAMEGVPIRYVNQQKNEVPAYM